MTVNWKRYFAIFFSALLLSLTPLSAQVFDMVVDASGSGDFETVQAALDNVPANSSNRTLIFIKAGVYTEKVWVKSTKTNVSLIGEDAETVLIQWNDYQGKDGLSGADSYTLLAEGADLYMENITVENTAGPVGQAVAIRTIGERQVFKACRFLGNQDTYYAHKNRQYNYQCYIEGNTDFIYGDATCVFDSCTVNSIRGGSYITAPADSKLITKLTTGDFIHGLLFRYCNITADSNVSDKSVYLGRPWQPNASSVFIQSTLGAHIKAAGWSTWSDNNHLSSVFAEYQNTNEAGDLINVANRVSWSSQLTESQATNLYGLRFFLRKSFVEWDPTPLVVGLDAPSALAINGNTLSWSAVADAKGYLIYKDEVCVGTSATASFTDDNMADIASYKVVSVNSNGTLSEGDNSGQATAVTQKKTTEISIYVKPDGIYLASPASVNLFDLTGKSVARSTGTTFVPMQHLNNGIYIVKVTEIEGNSIVKKIVYRR